MKKAVVFLAIIIFVVAILYSALYVFLNVKGKTLVIDTITQKFQLEPKLENLRFSFPFKIELKEFLCGDVSFSLAKIELVGINPFKAKFIFDNLYIENLKVKAERSKDEIVIQPFLKGESIIPILNNNQSRREFPEIISSALASEPEVSKKVDNKKPTLGNKISFTIKNALLKNASIEIVDTTFQPPMRFSLKNLNIKVRNFQYPQMTNFYVDLTSSLLFKDTLMSDILEFKGWIDLAKKNMEAKLKINNYDYVAFSDYYPPFWKPDNLELKEAALSLDADLNSQNNDLAIDAMLTLEKIVFKDNPKDPSNIESLKAVIALFQKDSGKPKFRFPTLKTRMDKLELNYASIWEKLQKTVKVDFIDTITRFLGKTPQMIGERTEDVKKITIDPAIGVVKEVLEGLKDIFTKEEEEGNND